MRSIPGFLLSLVVVLVITFATVRPATGQGLAVVAPPPDFANAFGSYALDYFNGSLYLSNGDSLFRLDESGGDPGFVPVASGFRPDDDRGQDGGLALSADGTVLVPVGFNGGATFANLSDTPITPTPAPDIDNDPADPSSDPDNIFSVAGADAGRFFVLGDIIRNDQTGRVYAFTPDTGNASLVTILPGGFATGIASGGIDVAADGHIIASTYDFFNGNATFYDIDPLTGVATPLATVAASGSGSLVVDDDGTIYFGSNTGIAQLVLPSASSPLGDTVNLVGNINDPDPFGSPAVTLNGLALDRVNNRLFFARQVGEDFIINDLLVPEPSAAALLLGLSTLFIARRRRATR